MNRVLTSDNLIITNSFASHQAKKSGHIYGVDVVAEGYKTCGIVAHSDGVVRRVVDYVKGHEVDKTGMGYGNQVVIEHLNGICTIYNHLSPDSICVKVGSVVKRGQGIGYMGDTGNSTGAHLDFAVIKLRSAWSDSINLVDGIGKTFDYYNPEEYLAADLPNQVVYHIQVNAYNNLFYARVFRLIASNRLGVQAIIKEYPGEDCPYRVQVYAFYSQARAEMALDSVRTVYPKAFITTKGGIDIT